MIDRSNKRRSLNALQVAFTICESNNTFIVKIELFNCELTFDI